jgi:hypothetical protein
MSYTTEHTALIRIFLLNFNHHASTKNYYYNTLIFMIPYNNIYDNLKQLVLC